MKKVLIFAAIAVAAVLVYNSYKKRKAAAAEEAKVATEDAQAQIALVADTTEKNPFLTDYDKFVAGFENLGVSYDVES